MSAPGANAAALLLALLLLGCASPAPDAPRGYAFRVMPGTTFDLAQGRTLDPAEQAARLEPVRLLFLGEHHTDAASHQAQLETLRLLHDHGHALTVALEMFSPAADAALEDWRRGKLDELQFLEHSHWYDAWGFPWRYYRGLFLWFREQQIPLHGVNADEATRTAARRGKLEDLPAAEREELGDLDIVLEPHRDLLLETLRAGGHAGEFTPDSPRFQGFLRVQTLWDRLMGQLAARLAAAQQGRATVVLLIGSGHLAYKLGANLQAARATPLPQLTVWDAPVADEELDARGRAYVPIGIGDWVRVHRQDPGAPDYPSLSGVKLAAAAEGVRVEALTPFAAPWLTVLHTGDAVVTLNGLAAASPTQLRLAVESLPWDQPATLSVIREGKTLPLVIYPRHDRP